MKNNTLIDVLIDEIFSIGKKHNPYNASLTDEEGYEGMFINYKELVELRDKFKKLSANEEGDKGG